MIATIAPSVTARLRRREIHENTPMLSAIKIVITGTTTYHDDAASHVSTGQRPTAVASITRAGRYTRRCTKNISPTITATTIALKTV